MRQTTTGWILIAAVVLSGAAGGYLERFRFGLSRLVGVYAALGG